MFVSIENRISAVLEDGHITMPHFMFIEILHFF